MEKQIRHEGCAACKLADMCHTAEAKEKSGLAVLLAFGAPLVLMLAVLLVVKLLNYSDGIVAVSMLAVLILYYLGLWLFRSRVARCISFQTTGH